jgi:hypothetical protein
MWSDFGSRCLADQGQAMPQPLCRSFAENAVPFSQISNSGNSGITAPATVCAGDKGLLALQEICEACVLLGDKHGFEVADMTANIEFATETGSMPRLTVCCMKIQDDTEFPCPPSKSLSQTC